jgi:hypothetical protein
MPMMRAMLFAQRKGYEPGRDGVARPPGPNLRPRYSIVERDQPSMWFQEPAASVSSAHRDISIGEKL